MSNVKRRLIAFATKGTGSNDELRLRELLCPSGCEFLPFDKRKKFKSLVSILKRLRKEQHLLIVMEGTGIAGGIACILSKLLFGHKYVVSSGDAVGPFVATHYRLLGPVFWIYELLLCKFSSGFIGWTPYLLGRAMTFGAPSGVTAPGWVIGRPAESGNFRYVLREKWKIPQKAIVFGMLGALTWNHRRKYCYGMELVRAIKASCRHDIAAVIVGAGEGYEHLRRESGSELGKRIFLVGPVELDEVMMTLQAFDIASLPQSTDQVGRFRYTTKISEYAAAGLPVVTSRIPAAYDLGPICGWRLPGEAPWSTDFIGALAALMNEIQRDKIPKPETDGAFSRHFVKEDQVQRVWEYLSELLEEC